MDVPIMVSTISAADAVSRVSKRVLCETRPTKAVASVHCRAGDTFESSRAIHADQRLRLTVILFRTLWALLLGSLAFAQTNPAASDDPDRMYHELAARLQSGDLSIDFRALRLACSSARDCEVRGNLEDLGAQADALRREDWAAARQVCEKLLSRGYADIEAHATLAAVYVKLGDQRLADFHLAVVAGLMRSIRATSGDTKETAIEVISRREIFAVMASLGLPYFGSNVSSRTITDGAHQYTVMEARDPKTNQGRALYFNLDKVSFTKDVPNRP
jgi:hypothetical protein